MTSLWLSYRFSRISRLGQSAFEKVRENPGPDFAGRRGRPLQEGGRDGADRGQAETGGWLLDENSTYTGMVFFYRKIITFVRDLNYGCTIDWKENKKSPTPGGIWTHNLKSFALQTCALPLCYNHCPKFGILVCSFDWMKLLFEIFLSYFRKDSFFYWSHVAALTCRANAQSTNTSLTWIEIVCRQDEEEG